MKKIIVFTDLDGTLIDDNTYSFEKAMPALQLLKERNIPLVICSSKTAKEIEYYREKLENYHPFISENGSGIFIPKDYFNFGFRNLKFEITEANNYLVIRLGAKYSDLRKTIEELRKKGFPVRGFGDMSAQEVAESAHMNITEAEMAKKRDFDEPFTFEGTGEETEKLLEAIALSGFHYTKGRFFHIIGNTDKGKAVSILIDLYKKEFGALTAIAIGDNINDIPMINSVEYPILVQRPDKTYAVKEDITNLRKVDGIGPDGWNRGIIEYLSKIGDKH